MKEAATTKSRQNVNIWQAFNLTMLENCHGFDIALVSSIGCLWRIFQWRAFQKTQKLLTSKDQRHEWKFLNN